MRAGGRRTTALLAVVFVAALALLSVLVAIGWHPLQSTDIRVDDAVHDFALAHAGVVSTARALTHLGDPLVVTVLTFLLAGVLLLMRRARAAVYVLVVRVLAIVMSSSLKLLVDRPRPAFAHPFAHPHGQSFPSGHALGSAALWGSVAVVVATSVPPVVRVLVGVVVPVVVAATRVVLGAHFVTDVVAGLALGWGIAALCAIGLRGRPARRQVRGSGPPVTP